MKKITNFGLLFLKFSQKKFCKIILQGDILWDNSANSYKYIFLKF